MRTTILLLALLAAAFAGEEQTTPSGIRYEILAPGEPGTNPSPGDRVKVHYDGTFEDGTKFDSSRDRGTPFEFMVGAGQVIQGWDEALPLMTVGMRARFHIPWQLAYGETGVRDIPPRADLVFVVELLGVEKGKPFPAFRRLDATTAKRTESGVLYDVLDEGTGDLLRPEQGVRLRFVLWNDKGQVVICSDAAGNFLAGQVARLRLGRLQVKFLEETVPLMRPGAKYMLEVPPELCFGAQAVSPKLPANTTTVWFMEVVETNEIPAFQAVDATKATTTATGLLYEVVRQGEGAQPRATDTVKVHYTGWLENGTSFDSSHARGEPVAFPLDRVIAGWTEGVCLMKAGSIYRFSIPGRLAYGAHPPPGSGIPPNATLIFLIELIEVAGG